MDIPIHHSNYRKTKHLNGNILTRYASSEDSAMAKMCVVCPLILSSVPWLPPFTVFTFFFSATSPENHKIARIGQILFLGLILNTFNSKEKRLGGLHFLGLDIINLEVANLLQLTIQNRPKISFYSS